MSKCNVTTDNVSPGIVSGCPNTYATEKSISEERLEVYSIASCRGRSGDDGLKYLRSFLQEVAHKVACNISEPGEKHMRFAGPGPLQGWGLTR